MPKATPIHEVRYGTIQAAIWENDTDNGARYNTTFVRRYRDADGKWKSSQNFGRQELLLLAKVANEAHTWIYVHGKEERDGNGDHSGKGHAESSGD